MKTFLQVLSEDGRAQVHERTLRILAKTGLQSDCRGPFAGPG